jgi:hypothetical protein
MSASIAASHAASSATALRSQSAPLEPRTITHCTASLYENLRELKRKEDQELLRRPLKEYGLFNPHNTKQSINIDELKKLARHWKLHHQISGFWKLHTTEQQLAQVLLKHMVNAHLFQEPVHKAVVEEALHMRRPVRPAANRRRTLRLEQTSSSSGSSSSGSSSAGAARLFRPYNGDLFSTHESGDGLMLMSRFAKPEVAAAVVAAAPVAVAVLPAASKTRSLQGARSTATMLIDDSSERGRRVLSNSSIKSERPGRVLSNSSSNAVSNKQSSTAAATSPTRVAGGSIKSSSSKGALATASRIASRAELSRYRSAGELSTLSISTTSSESCFDEAQEEAENEAIAAARG